MTNRTWVIFIAVVVVLFGGLLFVASRDNINVDKVDTNRQSAASKETGDIADHVYGATDSKVVLTEYGDFQCPGCGAAYQPIKTVTDTYKTQLSFIFRNFPLTSVHPNARAAAAAAEAAGLMGKYWQMHDKLYENQDQWNQSTTDDRTTIFAGYAEAIGLDKNQFTKTLTDKVDQINQKISYDQALGKKLNITGTPGIYLNGKRIDNQTYDTKTNKLSDKAPTNDGTIAYVWSNAKALDELMLKPAFDQAGIDISTAK